MGNSQTKEARGPPGPSNRHTNGTGSPAAAPDSSNAADVPSRPAQHTRRSSRPDFSSFLGIGGSNEQDPQTLEQRRENKAEREARKIEKERQARLRERERSMREEHVDGGYLVTQGVYVGPEDYNKVIVRLLMIERRLAPFWRGLNDYSDSWAEHQLMAAARGMEIPPADHVPPELEYTMVKSQPSDATIKSMAIPMHSRSQSAHSDALQTTAPPNNSLPSPPAPGNATSPIAPVLRTRAKTLASLTSRHNGSSDAAPREFQLPADPFVNGQPIEVYLYKDASECPICFLYYPPYLNTTRCCEQPICSECFVQIKRPDPHPPEHEQPDPNAPPVSEEERLVQVEGLLVSEVASCPYCKQPEFGITYTPPGFRRGLTYNTGMHPNQPMSPMSSQTSLSSGQMSPNRRRGTSLSANAPEVITTDKVRPDWHSKLQAARAHAARRSAAATALHAAAYMVGPQERPSFPGFGRRGMRRLTLEGESATDAQRHAIAFLADRHNQIQSANMILPPPRDSSARRSRIDDIEELMMIEAIRMSLASEEERRRKEEKDAKKKAKKEEKETRRAGKTGRKNSFLSGMPSPNGQSSTNPLERSMSNTSSLLPEDSSAKGKEIQRNDEVEGVADAEPYPLLSSVPGSSQDSLSSAVPVPLGTEPFRRSHLRQMSNVSSASSSFVEPGIDYSASGTPTGSAPAEPLFNFRSLTAMITEDEKRNNVASAEHREGAVGRQPSLESLDDLPFTTGSPPSHENGFTQDESTHNSKKPEVLVQSTTKQANNK